MLQTLHAEKKKNLIRITEIHEQLLYEPITYVSDRITSTPRVSGPLLVWLMQSFRCCS